MSYRVHRFDIDMEKDASRLEALLNGLSGEVVAIIPHIKKTTLAQIYGATRKVDFLLIVERAILRKKERIDPDRRQCE